MPSLKKEEVANILKNLPPDMNKGRYLKYLKTQGYELEGFEAFSPKNTSVVEDQKSGFLGKAAGFLGGIAKDVGTTFLRPESEMIATGYEIFGKTPPKFTESTRLLSPEARAKIFTKDIGTPQAQQFIQSKKDIGAEGAGFTDALNVLTVIPGLNIIKPLSKIPVIGKIAKGLSALEQPAKSIGGKIAKGIGLGAEYGGSYEVAKKLDEGITDVNELFSSAVSGGISGGATGGVVSGVFSIPQITKNVAEALNIAPKKLSNKAIEFIRDNYLRISTPMLEREQKAGIDSAEYLLENNLIGKTKKETYGIISKKLKEKEALLQNDLENVAETISPKDVINSLKSILKEKTFKFKVATKNKIQSIVSSISKNIENIDAPISISELNIIKRNLWDAAYSESDKIISEGHLQIGFKIMKLIEEKVPSAKPINQELKNLIYVSRAVGKSLNKNTKKIVSSTVARIVGALLGIPSSPEMAAVGAISADTLNNLISSQKSLSILSQVLFNLGKRSIKIPENIIPEIVEKSLAPKIPTTIKVASPDRNED